MIKFTYKELRMIVENFDHILSSVDTSAIEYAEGLSEECKRNIKQLLCFDDETLNNDEDINRILVKTLMEFYSFFVYGFDIPDDEIFMDIIEKLREEICEKEEDDCNEQ